MSVHPGRATLAVLVLAEFGALAGALLCWLFLLTWMVRAAGLPAFGDLYRLGEPLLGSLLWACVVGGPAGAILMSVLGLTALRRVPVGRALGSVLGGAAIGLFIAMVLLPRHGPMWPVPSEIPALACAGVLGGVLAARGQRPAIPAPRAA